MHNIKFNADEMRDLYGTNTHEIAAHFYALYPNEDPAKLHDSLCEALLKNNFPNTWAPWKYQVDGVEWLTSERFSNGNVCLPYFGVIGDEMGVGKTSQALNAIRSLILKGKRGLFLVPTGQMIIQWQKQYNRWINDCEPDEFGMDGLIALRSSSAVIPSGMCCAMSHSMLARTKMVERLINANFDFIVIDEIHKFGAQGTKRIKNLWNLMNATPSHFADGCIALSGTPVRNYAKEIRNVAWFVGFEPARTMEGFARRYLTYDWKALHNPNAFHKDFAAFYLRRTSAEVQKDLPPINRTKVYTEITDQHIINAYNKELDVMSNFERNAEKLDAFSMLGYLIKLRHITGIAKAKEPAIIEPIREYMQGENGESTQRKVVIGIHHHFVSARLKRSLPEFKHYIIRGGMGDFEKERVKNEFINHKGAAILQLSIKAAGEGIDGLQYSGATKVIVFERQWNSRDEEQFEKRVHRTGQKETCNIEQTIAVGTVDEFFDDLCEEKLRYTTQVEDKNWQNNPAFLRTLWDRVISNRLPSAQLKTYEDDENLIESVYSKPSLEHPIIAEDDLNAVLAGKDIEI